VRCHSAIETVEETYTESRQNEPTLFIYRDCTAPDQEDFFGRHIVTSGGSVAEWLACWTQAQKARVQIAAATLSGNSVRQSVHTHRASVHPAAKVVAALLRVAGVTAGRAESNGSLPPGL